MGAVGFLVSAALVEAADLDLVVAAFLGAGAALAVLAFLAMIGFFAVFAALGAAAFSLVVEALVAFAADLGAFAATGLFCFPN